MNGKITLITPPDFFENDNHSILFAHLNDADQEIVSKWLSTTNIMDNINVYFYDKEIEITWLLYAAARCNYKFFDLDNSTNTTTLIASYLLGKKNSFYKTDDENKVAVFSHINQNRIINIERFLEQAFNDKIIKS